MAIAAMIAKVIIAFSEKPSEYGDIAIYKTNINHQSDSVLMATIRLLD